MTVEELAQRMTAREFAEWQVYESVEGLPGSRADWQRAMHTAITANVHRKKGSKAHTPSDFIPGIKPDGRPPRKPRGDGSGLGFFLGYLDAKAKN